MVSAEFQFLLPNLMFLSAKTVRNRSGPDLFIMYSYLCIASAVEYEKSVAHNTITFQGPR